MQKLLEYVRQFGRFQRNARLYLLMNALISIASGVILVLYPLYLSALGYHTDFIGLVLFATTLGMALTVFPAGLCVDHFSSKALLIWSGVLIAVGVLGQILLRDPVLLFISAFVAGIGTTFQFILSTPFLIANSAPAERGHLFSLGIVLTLLTNVIGDVFGGAFPIWLRAHPWAMLPQLSWLLASSPLPRSYQITLLLGILIALLGFLPLFLLSRDRPIRTRRNSSRTRLAPVRSLFVRGKIKVASTRREATGVTFWQRLRLLLFNPLVIMAGYYILVDLGGGVISPYFNLFFVVHLGLSSALFGLMSGVARIFTALAVLLAPWMATRIGRLKTIVYTSLLSIPILLLVGLSPFLMVSVFLYPLYQGSWNMANGIWQVFGMEIVPPERRGLANSSYQLSGQIAGAVAVPIGGLLINRLGYTPIFWIVAVLYLLSQALLWFPFGGKDFVAPDASVGTMGEGQREEGEMMTSSEDAEQGQDEDGKVMTSSEDTERGQDDEEARTSPTSHSDEAERV